MIIFRDHLFNVVCNIRTPKADGKISIGTGSFIIKDNKVYLLTADHVAKSIHHQTEQILEKQTRNECLKRIFITVFISVVKNERSSLRNLLLIFQTN